MPTKNWAGNLEIDPRTTASPRNVDAVVASVVAAERAGRRVRAIGSAWSFNDVIHTDDVLIRLDRLNAIHGYAQGGVTWGRETTLLDRLRPSVTATDRRFVHFQAGVTVNALYRALDRPAVSARRPTDPTPAPPGRGRWALLTMGASSGQTFVGALSTGTHGADHGLPPIADSVRGIHLVGPGGTHHWFERSEERFRITERAGPLTAIPGLQGWNLHYDDERFFAALVGLGCMGVIVSVVVEAREQYGLSQRLSPMRWSAIKAAHRSEQLFSHEAIRTRHPATTASGRRVNAVPEALEIFLNPYRTDDRYDGTSSGDRNCLVVERRRAAPLDGRPGAFDRPFSPPDSGVDELGLILDVEAHGPDSYRTRIDEVIRTARAETTGYPVAHSVLDTYDGTTEALPALSMEIVVPTSDDRWIRFVDWILANFDLLVRRGKKFAGFMSLRFTRPTGALLGMQNFEQSPRERVCHIEIFGLKEINVAGMAVGEILGAIFTGGISTVGAAAAGESAFHPDVDHSGNFEGAGDDFVATFEDSVAAVDARMHWGQLCRLDRAEVEDAYRSALPLWRKVRTELAAGGSHKTFSNGFSERCGLEANNETLAVTSWGPGRYDAFTYDEQGNVLQLWWDGRWHWDDLGHQFYDGGRFYGPLTAASWGPNRIDVFGLGRGSNVYHLWWDGRWHWDDLGNGFGDDQRFAGPITASSWGEGRLDVFGLSPRGNVLQLWYDGRWHWSDLGNHFPHNQRFSGSLTATSWGPGRIDVFGLGRGGQLLQLWFERGWHWSRLPPVQKFAGPVAAASWGPGRLDLIGLGRANNVLHTWYHGDWREEELGNGFPGRVTKLGMAGDFAPDPPTDTLYRFERHSVPPNFVGPISAASWGPDRLDAFGVDSRGHILQLWYDGRWRWADLGRSW